MERGWWMMLCLRIECYWYLRMKRKMKTTRVRLMLKPRILNLYTSLENYYLLYISSSIDNFVSRWHAVCRQPRRWWWSWGSKIIMEKMKAVEDFAADGCSYSIGFGRTPCCRQFSLENYPEMKGCCNELTKRGRDLEVTDFCDAFNQHTHQALHSTLAYTWRPPARVYSSYFHQG